MIPQVASKITLSVRDRIAGHWRPRAAASGVRRVGSLQQGDNLLRGGDQHSGIGLGNGLSALSLDHVDEGAQCIDRREIVLYAGPVEGAKGGIQLCIEIVLNPVLEVDARDLRDQADDEDLSGIA
jgi:hypothetical protein